MPKANKGQQIGKLHLAIVVDRSGSMSAIQEDMEGGLNSFLKDQCKQPGDCLVTLTQFDTEFEVVHDNVSIKEVGKFELHPRGSTALLDAMGRTIGMVESQIAACPKDERPDKVIVLVITDGMENASQEWSRQQVMALVKKLSAKNWEFTFLGANQDAIQEGSSLGVRADASLNYLPTSPGVAAAFAGASGAVLRVRSGAAVSLCYNDREREAAYQTD